VAEPHWMSYVGVATGVVAIIISIMNYRKINNLKVLDLRLELRKAVSEARVSIKQLSDLIHAADRSRMNNLSARGISGGQTASWKGEVKEGHAKLGALNQRVPAEGLDFKTLGQSELESELVAVHKCQKELEVLRDKFESAMNSDRDFRMSKT